MNPTGNENPYEVTTIEDGTERPASESLPLASRLKFCAYSAVVGLLGGVVSTGLWDACLSLFPIPAPYRVLVPTLLQGPLVAWTLLLIAHGWRGLRKKMFLAAFIAGTCGSALVLLGVGPVLMGWVALGPTTDAVFWVTVTVGMAVILYFGEPTKSLARPLILIATLTLTPICLELALVAGPPRVRQNRALLLWFVAIAIIAGLTRRRRTRVAAETDT